MEDKDSEAATAAAAAAAVTAKLTLLSLPPEIILSIVEWVERIVRADKVRQEDDLLDDEEAAMAAAGGANGDGDGEDEMMFQMPPQPEAAGAAAAPEANIGGAGIGGAGFLNNLFGWAIGGGGGNAGNAGAAAAAPQGNAANLGGGFAAVNVGPQPAGLAGLMQALGGQPGQGMPTMGGHPGADSADSDDEMPRECRLRLTRWFRFAVSDRADTSMRNTQLSRRFQNMAHTMVPQRPRLALRASRRVHPLPQSLQANSLPQTTTTKCRASRVLKTTCQLSRTRH